MNFKSCVLFQIVLRSYLRAPCKITGNQEDGTKSANVNERISSFFFLWVIVYSSVNKNLDINCEGNAALTLEPLEFNGVFEVGNLAFAGGRRGTSFSFELLPLFVSSNPKPPLVFLSSGEPVKSRLKKGFSTTLQHLDSRKNNVKSTSRKTFSC